MIPLRIYFRIFYYLRARFVVANLIKMTEKIMFWQSVLVCWGDKYSNAQVNKLVDQIIKNDSNCIKCVLFTDTIRDGINPVVEQKIIPEFYLTAELTAVGCHAKLCMFEKGILDVSLPAIYIDLDTLVFGPLGQILNELKSDKHLMMIPGRGNFRALRRLFAKNFGGRKFGRANSSAVVFHPVYWHSVSDSFRSKIKKGVKLEGEYMVADDRYLAWFAQQKLQVIPTSYIVKFGTEFVLPTAWMSRLKGRLPWVEKRRSRLLAITFPGNNFEPEKLAKLRDSMSLADHRKRPLIWDDGTIGVSKKKIQSYFEVS